MKLLDPDGGIKTLEQAVEKVCFSPADISVFLSELTVILHSRNIISDANVLALLGYNWEIVRDR